jgi:hypothetical protein
MLKHTRIALVLLAACGSNPSSPGTQDTAASSLADTPVPAVTRAAADCEFYVDRVLVDFYYDLAATQRGTGLPPQEYLEASFKVKPSLKHVERQGIIANGKDVFLVGTPPKSQYERPRLVGPNAHLDILPWVSNGTGGYLAGSKYPLEALRFFIDVNRDGKLERLIVTGADGKDFKWPEVFRDHPNTREGRVRINDSTLVAAPGSPLLHQKAECQKYY